MAVEDGYPVPSRSGLAALIEEHWQTHARDLYRELKRIGELESAALRKADETIEDARSRQAAGLTVREAWEAAMREVALAVPS